MNPIQKLLERWKGVPPPERITQNHLATIIQKHTRVGISPQNITISRDTAFVACSSLGKAEIYIKKKEILNDLAVTLGKTTIKDVR